jgi:hypothetical protein
MIRPRRASSVGMGHKIPGCDLALLARLTNLQTAVWLAAMIEALSLSPGQTHVGAILRGYLASTTAALARSLPSRWRRALRCCPGGGP